METLSVKYICKLLALILLLCIGFIYKVPKAEKRQDIAKHASELPQDARYTNVSTMQPTDLNQLYNLVVPDEDSPAIINL